MDSIAHSLAACKTPPRRIIHQAKTPERPLSRVAGNRCKPQAASTMVYSSGYICSGCGDPFPSTHAAATPTSASPSSTGPFIIDADENARIVCPFCLREWMNTKSCWKCGDEVQKDDEKVKFGNTHWHRPCFACIFCAAPLKVPGKEGESTLELFESPMCAQCGESLGGNREEAGRLAVMGQPKSARKILGLRKWRRRGKEEAITEEPQLPKGMMKEQSISRPDSHPTRVLAPQPLPLQAPLMNHAGSATHGVSSFGALASLMSPPKWMLRPLRSINAGNLQQPLGTKPLPRSHSLFTFPTSSGEVVEPIVKQKRKVFENLDEGIVHKVRFEDENKRSRSPYERPVSRKKIRSRAPSPVPSGMGARRQITSYTCETGNASVQVVNLSANADEKRLGPNALPLKLENPMVLAESGQNANSFHSTEFLEKVRKLRHSVSTKSLVPDTKSVCPCCNNAVEGGRSSIHGQDKQRYHVACFLCRICGGKLNPATKRDECFYFEKLPYHRRCVADKAGLSTSSSLQKPVDHNDARNHELELSHSTNTIATEVDGASSTLGEQRPPPPPEPVRRMPKTPAKDRATLVPLQRSISVWTMSGRVDPTCTGCKKPMNFLDEVPGPKRTRFHWLCMKCHGCETQMGEDGTRWFELDTEGEMVLFCRHCWRVGREAKGHTAEQIERDEIALQTL